MLVPGQEAENGTIRLYFDENRICIGSYAEVERYEQEKGKSYQASEFFRLPGIQGYDPIGKTPEQIGADKSNAFRQKLKAKQANS